MSTTVGSADMEHVPAVGIALTVAFGMLLAVWPISVELRWLRPEFGFLLVFYWMNRLPFRLGLTFAWCVGLVFDVVNGGILCQRALAMTVVAYLLIIFHSQIKRSGIVGEMFFVFALMQVYSLLVFWLGALNGKFIWQWELLLPALATSLAWPLFGRVMSRFYG